MTETTRYLDLYRKPLLDDKEAFQVLNLLMREGPLSKKSLREITSTSDSMLGNLLNELYRASLLTTTDEYVNLSGYAEAILSQLGSVELAIKSYIPTVRDDDRRLAFLNACVEYNHHIDNKYGQQSLYLLRSFARVTKDMEDRPHSSSELARPYYLMIVGLNPMFQKLGSVRYFNSVLDWHRGQRSTFWHRDSQSVLEGRQMFFRVCRRADSDVKHSDEILAGKTAVSKDPALHSIYWATLARLVSATVLENPDSDLVDLFSRNHELPETTMLSLGIWGRYLERACYDSEETIHFLSQHDASFIESFAYRLRNILQRKLQEREGGRPMLLEAVLDSTAEARDRLTNPRDAMNHLSMLREELNSGAFDDLTIDEQDTLSVEARLLADAFSQRFVPDRE